jgi:hypothetical protein
MRIVRRYVKPFYTPSSAIFRGYAGAVSTKTPFEIRACTLILRNECSKACPSAWMAPILKGETAMWIR